VWASGCLGTSWSASTCRIAASLRSQAVPIVWASGCQHQPDRCQAAYAHRRCRSCGRPDAGFWPDAHVAHVATPVHLATGTRLPAVDATRTNVGDLGGNDGTCRIVARRLTLTGGADRVGVRMPGDVVVGQHLPDRSQASDAHMRCRSCERPDAGFWPSG